MSESTDVVDADVTGEQPAAPPAAAPAMKKEFGKDLAVIGAAGAQVPMPTNYAQMKDMASMMAQGGPMIGKAFRGNPGACMAIISQAMRWGMDPYSVSQKAYVASRDGDGPIGYEAQLVTAVVQTSPLLTKRLRCKYEGEGDDRRCIVTGWLKDEDEPFEYKSPPVKTLKKERNKGSPLWYDDPDQQLWYYSSRSWARKWVPDVLMGIYTPDEIMEMSAFGGTPVDQGQNVRLSDLTGGDVEQPKEAEFTDVGDQLARKAAAKTETKKPAKTKAAAKPPAEKETAATGEGSGREEATRVSVAVEAAGPKTDTPPADADSDDGHSEDEQLLLAIETTFEAARSGDKKRIVLDHRGFLTMLAEGEDRDLGARATALLDKFELPPVK